MQKQRGFTLVELLVVIAIITLMAGMVVLNLDTANKKNRDEERQKDLSEIQLALARYYYDQLVFPSSASEQDVNLVLQELLVPKYMSSLPQDPKENGEYSYTYEGNAESYTLRATMEYYEPEIYVVTNETR